MMLFILALLVYCAWMSDLNPAEKGIIVGIIAAIWFFIDYRIGAPLALVTAVFLIGKYDIPPFNRWR